jgi:hypothetical protein
MTDGTHYNAYADELIAAALNNVIQPLSKPLVTTVSSAQGLSSAQAQNFNNRGIYVG